MAIIRDFLVGSVLFSCLVAICNGATFSSLQRTLIVEASHKQGILNAGEDEIKVEWSFNKTFPASTESSYKKIKVKLCYAPISQQDRSWRKTENELKKDKTCQFNIVERPYPSSANSFTWKVERDVPTATYFVRAYAYDSSDHEVAYGQTTDAAKKTNLFELHGISGRHSSLDICAVAFSAFSVISLSGFFFREKRQAKRAAAMQK